MIRAVFFDIGETILDETRSWFAWAEWLDIPPLTLAGVLGAVIGQGRHHSEAFGIVRPGIDLEAERAKRVAAGGFDGFKLEDLYPDALPCMKLLKEQSYFLGAAGNFSASIEASLRAMDLPLDVLASSGRWGVEKPSPGFFEHVAAEAGFPPEQVAYVGDRIDNDILPALDAGMTAVHIRRGPWGYLHATWPEAERASARIESLTDLPAVLR